MKLLRYGARGQELPGIFDEQGHARDLSAQMKDVQGKVHVGQTMRVGITGLGEQHQKLAHTI